MSHQRSTPNNRQQTWKEVYGTDQLWYGDEEHYNIDDREIRMRPIYKTSDKKILLERIWILDSTSVKEDNVEFIDNIAKKTDSRDSQKIDEIAINCLGVEYSLDRANRFERIFS